MQEAERLFACFLYWKLWKIAITTFVVSLAIESIQFFFVGRLSDIDDLIMNTAGGIVGYLILCFVMSVAERHDISKIKEKIGWGSLGVIINIVVLLLMIPIQFTRICFGDLVFGSLLTDSMTWSDNSSYIQSYTGIHWTMLYLEAMLLIAVWMSKKHKEDLMAGMVRKVSPVLMVLCGVLLLTQFVLYR